jgi:hypothetical protein
VTTIELIFSVDPMDDDVVWEIYEKFDAVVATHSGITLIEVSVEGNHPVRAAKKAVRELERIDGVHVLRCYEDLVSRADIAERASATVQAVGHWIRGTRHKGHPFPQAFNLVNGGVWLWGEVNNWLARVGKPVDNAYYPSREDHLEVNKWITERCFVRQLALTSGTSSNWKHVDEITPALVRRDSGNAVFSWREFTAVQNAADV